MSLKQQAADIYTSDYKALKLAPKHVIQLKEVLVKALKEKAKPKEAAKAWFKEKGIAVTTTVISQTVVPTKKAKRPIPEDDMKEAAEAAQKSKRTPIPTMERTVLTKKDIKAIIPQLQAAGIKIEYDKTEELEALHKRINAAMAKLATPETVKLLATLDPDGLDAVPGQQKCHGIFIDLGERACVNCGDVASCQKAYLVNLKGDFSRFASAMKVIKVEEEANDVDEAVVEAVKAKTPKQKESPQSSLIGYEPKRLMLLMPIENPLAEDKPAFASVEKLLADPPANPMTEKQLRTFMEEDWEIASDRAFVNTWVIGLRKIGVLAFVEDLDDEVIAEFDDDSRKHLVKTGFLKK